MILHIACLNATLPNYHRAETCALVVFRCRAVPGANFFSITMLRQHSQYDSRLGFSFRVLVRVRVRVRLGLG